MFNQTLSFSTTVDKTLELPGGSRHITVLQVPIRWKGYVPDFQLDHILSTLNCTIAELVVAQFNLHRPTLFL
jgi:hypothetical protein